MRLVEALAKANVLRLVCESPPSVCERVPLVTARVLQRAPVHVSQRYRKSLGAELAATLEGLGGPESDVGPRSGGVLTRGSIL